MIKKMIEKWTLTFALVLVCSLLTILQPAPAAAAAVPECESLGNALYSNALYLCFASGGGVEACQIEAGQIANFQLWSYGCPAQF